MKNRSVYWFVLIFLVAGFKTITLLGQQWSPPIRISGGRTPDLDIDPKTGHLHIISMYNGVTYTNVAADGTILFQESVPGANSDEGGWRFGASVSVDTLGCPYVCYRIFKDPDLYDGYYTYRTASGWSTPVRLFKDVKRGYVFRIDIDSQNRAHIARGSAEDNVWGTVTYYRLINGQYSREEGGFTKYRADDRLEIDSGPNNNVHLILGCPDDNGGPVTYWRSINGGDSWVRIGDIHHPEAGGRNGSPDLFVDKMGTVHICYGSANDASRGNTPSARYARFENGNKIRDLAVTDTGELTSWHHGGGLASVAASDNGQYVVMAYLTTDGGALMARLSQDGGATWSAPEQLSTACGGYEGRDKQYLRAHGYTFYLVYPLSTGGVELRILRIPGSQPPVANAGGPYSGVEGTPIQFNASQSTDDLGIVKYQWDWTNDGVFDDSTTSPIIQHTYPDDYNGQVVLQVTDTWGQQTKDTTIVVVDNVNPTVAAGIDTTAHEGDLLVFSASVVDPGILDQHTFQWDFGDGSTANGHQVTHTYADNGVFTVSVTATDDDGGHHTDQKIVTIHNVAPVAEAGGPYTGKIGNPIPLTGSVTDPGSGDTHTFEWDLDYNGSYETPGHQVNAIFNQVGSYTVKLRVTDDDGGVGTDTAIVQVTSDMPLISPIPDQNINEGEPFTPIVLDDYVTDPVYPDDQLTWQYHGNENLLVTLIHRVVTVTVPDSEWFGTETITFVVTNPDARSDSTNVKFTVNPVNDPPVLGAVPEYSFNEDDSLVVLMTDLAPFVTDPDNAPAELYFEIITNNHIQWYADRQTNKLVLSATPDWYGTEMVILRVLDGSGGTDEGLWTITVSPVPDPPGEFSLLSPLEQTFSVWPDTICFIWQCALDPDTEDQVAYRWYLSHDSTFLVPGQFLESPVVLRDTMFVYKGQPKIQKDLCYWKVVAFDDDNLARESRNFGRLYLQSRSPIVYRIPDQTINENEAFLPIYLNEYVVDLDNEDSQITWHYHGNRHLLVTLVEQVVTLAPADSEWAGTEAITFVATDPSGLSDSTTAYFTIHPVNDPPRLASVPEVTFNEDESLKIPLSTLQALVKDPDNKTSEFQFQILDNVHILWEVDSNTQSMNLHARPHWNGVEVVTLKVSDGAGATDEKAWKITVTSLPDPPSTFSLISPTNITFKTWPDTVEFVWQRSIDPDPGETVLYWWMLSSESTFQDTAKFVVHPCAHRDTVLIFVAKKKISAGVYYWKVVAFSTDGLFTESSNCGTISILNTAVLEPAAQELPETYALLQNHPNPFSVSHTGTQLTYHLPQKAHVRLYIYNTLGQQVRILENQLKEPGVYTLFWDGRDDSGRRVSSGIYLCQFHTNSHIFYRKMLLLP